MTARQGIDRSAGSSSTVSDFGPPTSSASPRDVPQRRTVRPGDTSQ